MSATNYDGKGDAAFVEQRLDELTTPDTPSVEAAKERLDYEATREHIETAETPETVELTVEGETVTLETLPSGVGRYRPLTDVIRAQERGQDDEALLAVMTMVDRFIDASPDDYGRAFWDALDEQTIIDAYGDWLSVGAAGND